MSLFEQFMLLYPKQHDAPLAEPALKQLSHAVLTPSMLTFANKKITSAYREAPELRHHYDAFLTLCQQTLGQQKQTYVLPIILEHLSDADTPTALACFHVRFITKLFEINLGSEQNITSLAHFGRVFIANPSAFAAFLTYLVQKNVPPQAILETYLMQDYLRYHLRGLHAEENPVVLLYTLLEHNPAMQNLVSAAKHTCCPEPELSSYALNGKTCMQKKLISLPRPSENTELTPKEANLKNLHRVFGVPFLVNVLQWCFEHHHDDPYLALLQTLLNHQNVTHADIGLLLQYLREHQHLQQTLAHALYPQTIDALFEAHISGITRLLPYSTYLAKKISGETLQTYIQELKQAKPSFLDLIADLSALLKQFKTRHTAHARLAFHHLMELILEHPDVLDDEKLLRLLRKFQPTKHLLTQQSHAIEQAFDHMLHAHTNTSWEAFDYITLEDLWRDAHEKLTILQTIEENTPNTLPQDKYKLQSRLLTLFFPLLNHTFSLNNFAEKLGIEPCIDPNNIMPYERLLFEILVAIDEPTLRVEIITHLNTHLPETRPWQNTQFDDISLHMHAAHHGNTGFLQYLEMHAIKSPESYEALAVTSAQLKHWHFTQYIHQTHALKRPVIDNLLYMAVSQNASHAIPMLWQGKKHAPRLNIIEKSFTMAVKEGHVDCVNPLLACATPPCDTIITKGYKKALRAEQPRLLSNLMRAREKRHLPCLEKAIQHTQLKSSKLPKLSSFSSFSHVTHISSISSRAKHSKLAHTQSCDNFINMGRAPSQRQVALRKHGLFHPSDPTSSSSTSVTLPPVLSRQTST